MWCTSCTSPTLMLSLGQSDRHAAVSGCNPLFEGDLFRVHCCYPHAAHKGVHTVLLSVTLKCLRDLGKVSIECSIVAEDNTVSTEGSTAAFSDHGLAEHAWDMLHCLRLRSLYVVNKTCCPIRIITREVDHLC